MDLVIWVKNLYEGVMGKVGQVGQKLLPHLPYLPQLALTTPPLSHSAALPLIWIACITESFNKFDYCAH